MKNVWFYVLFKKFKEAFISVGVDMYNQHIENYR